VFKNDDVISDSIAEIQGIKYKERGRLFKKALIEVQGRSKIILEGKKDSIQRLYQRLLPFLSPELRVGVRYQSPYSQQSRPVPPVQAPHASLSDAPRFCPSCGIELLQNTRFCQNCGQSLIGITP